MEFIKLNVGDTKFYTDATTLHKYPKTRLGLLNVQSKEYFPEKCGYYFDRNPDLFNIILDFYRNDTIHIPPGICGVQLQRELEFWKIPFEYISECCRSNFLHSYNEIETSDKIQHVFEHSVKIENHGRSTCKCLYTLWLFLDEPSSSKAAKVYNIFFLLVVILSVLMAFLLTHHGLRDQFIDIETYVNWTESENLQIFINLDSPKEVLFATTKLPDWWYRIDNILLGFFTLEFVLRIIICPSKRSFFKQWLNVLDIVLNISMWTRFLIERNLMWTMKSYAVAVIYGLSYCMVSLRLLRIFRINKQYPELKVLFLSLKESIKELILLLVSFMILAALFANMIFYAEYTEPTTFPTAFSGMWWAVVTMTTVGYGDAVPKTTSGKVIGSVCTVCGLLILAMPIAIIATKFDLHYQKMKDIIKFQETFINVKTKNPDEEENKSQEIYFSKHNGKFACEETFTEFAYLTTEKGMKKIEISLTLGHQCEIFNAH